MQTEVSKTERYTPVNWDPTKICQAEVNKLLKELHVSNLIMTDELKENIVSFDVEDMYPSLHRAEVLKEVSRLIKLPHF